MPRRELLGFLLLLWGCAGTDLRPSTPVRALSFEELKQRVARIRGLSFQRDVALESKSFEELRALVEKSVIEEQGRDSLEQTARLFTRLGLLEEKTDWPKALAELRLFEQGLHYDSRSSTVFPLQEDAKPGVAFLTIPWAGENAAQSQLLQLYALTHILQEQNFRWPEQLKRRNTEDMALALGALTRGDAVLTGLAQPFGDGGENRQKLVEQMKEAPRFGAQIDRDLAQLPELLRHKTAFQYVQGSQFAMWAYLLKGWEGVNGLYNNPPVSTKQILHPESYYVKREQPVRITPWSLLREMGRDKIMEETLGELLIRILLSRRLSQEEAAQAAAGWAGDSLLVFQRGDAMVLAWVTAWENPKEAMEFFTSYRRSLERRHGISLEPAEPSGGILIASAPGGQRFLLEIRGNFVFFLDGVAAPRSLEIAEELWNELETGVEPQPFETARQGRQAPAARR